MGHDDVASGYPISTGFRRLTGCQRDPRDKGVTHTRNININMISLHLAFLKF